ncbi:unnamed protein product, partial [Polarella glacialis]
GAALYAAVCLHLGDPKAAQRALEGLLSHKVDLHLSLQPVFLSHLEDQKILSRELLRPEPGSLQALVQRAAQLARFGEAGGIYFRRHGALLLGPSDGRCQ